MSTIGVVEKVSEFTLDSIKEKFEFAYEGSDYPEDDPVNFKYMIFRVGSSNRLLAKIGRITIDLDRPGKAIFGISEFMEVSYVDTVGPNITRLNEHNLQALVDLFNKENSIIEKQPDKIPQKLSLNSALDLLSETYQINRQNIKITING